MLRRYFFWSLVNFAIALLLVAMSCWGWLPWNMAVFVILMAVLFFTAYSRPRETFWLFLVLLPLELIIVSPTAIPFSLRPFQLVGGVLFFATLLLWLEGRLKFKLLNFGRICLLCSVFAKDSCKLKSKALSFNWLDRLVFLLPLVSLLGLRNAEDQGAVLKQIVILASFVGLYWLGRNFLRTKRDFLEALWFSLVALKVVLLFSFYQMLAAKFGWKSFQVMAGRVNGTFTEPDWLGIYLVVMLAVALWLKLYARPKDENLRAAGLSWDIFYAIITNLLIFFIFLALFLTVARSAWLGALAVILVYLIIVWAQGGFRIVLRKIFGLGVAGLLALAIVLGGNFSSFHLANRAASSVSGLQKITVACLKSVDLPEQIESVADLENYNCRHINLEEIEQEVSAGHIVREVWRPDPNVEIRKDIYSQTYAAIKKHWLVGQGWGASGLILGQDEKGSALNSSNIFLEVLLSIGLLGLVIFTVALLFPVSHSARNIIRKKQLRYSDEFIVLTTVGFVVPNLFNSGFFLAFFWIWLVAIIGLISLKLKEDE